MTKFEILFTVILTVLCYSLYFIFKSWIYTSILNTLLLCFYILFVFGKLPKIFYREGNIPTSKTEIVCIWGGIAFLFCCWTVDFFPIYYKQIGRAGFVCAILTVCVVMLSTYMKRIFGELPKDVFLKNHQYYLRTVLIIFTNIYMVPACAYSYHASYNQNGRLISKEILDGFNEYKTKYVDSLSCYVTLAIINDPSDKDIKHLEYNIYYKKYPDVIEKIDTIKIVKREKKNHEKE